MPKRTKFFIVNDNGGIDTFDYRHTTDDPREAVKEYILEHYEATEIPNLRIYQTQHLPMELKIEFSEVDE